MRKLSKRTKASLLAIDVIGKAIKRRCNHFGYNDGTLSKEKIKNLLLLEQWGIGDLVMASYCLPALREHFSTTNITVLCSPAAAPLLAGCPYIDNVVSYQFPWTRADHKYALWQYQWMSLINLISKMREKKYDIALTGFPDARANLLLWLFGAKCRIGLGSRGGGFFLTAEPRNSEKDQYHLERWVAALRNVGCAKGLCKHDLWLSASELQEADQIMSRAGVSKSNIIVGIHYGASDPQRRWPLERFVDVALRVSRDPEIRILVFSDYDEPNKHFPCNDAIILPRVGIRTFAALISRLDVLLCNDSGAMHIAGAVGTPVVALFGKSDPKEFGPFGPEHIIVEADEMDCRPCFVKCRYPEPRCWATIAVSDVLEALEKHIQKIRPLKCNHGPTGCQIGKP